MEEHILDSTGSFVSPDERLRLVRLCAKITGNSDAAEDLAQETLLEAWRHEYALRNPEKRTQWLSGIAHNVCLRWIRTRGRDSAHLLDPHPEQTNSDMSFNTLENTLVDDFDIEVELERKELIALLDRAMALLPIETRTLLIKRYVEESPLSELAEQLGTNTSAAAMRLQRGKLALRRVLTTDMQHELAPYSIYPSIQDEWQETSLWCYYCGQHRLLAKRNSSEGVLLTKCPACSPGMEELLSESHLSILKDLKGYKPLYSRLVSWCHIYYRTGLNNGSALCEGCKKSIPVDISLTKDIPAWARAEGASLRWLQRPDERIISIVCPTCYTYSYTSLENLVVALPEGQQFMRVHPRIHMLPKQQVEAEGREAIVTRFESVNDNATFTVVSAYDTYEVLRIYREGDV